jgi:hypothetical protein
MAITRTGFRIYEFRRLDLDDLFFILAVLCLTATVTLMPFLAPLAIVQNMEALGQLGDDPSQARLGAGIPATIQLGQQLDEATSQ